MRVVIHGKKMPSLLSAVREQVHPLHQIRRIPFLRRALARVDVPIWIHVHGVQGRVRVRLVRDLSYLLLRRSPEPQMTSLVEASFDLLHPKTFWDVGAYFGYYGLLAYSVGDDVSVVFCEPDPQNADLIRQTIRRLSTTQLELLEVAMDDHARTASFVTDPISGATGSLTAEESAAHRNWGDSRVIEVQSRTLDGEAADAWIDMIKIDVEGHEEGVVRGGRQVIERCKPLMLFECFHGGDEICAYLETLGYETFDAERLCPRSVDTTNFFGLPPQHASRRDELLARWREGVEVR
jgi:FkbM family methyltransferase